MKARGYSVWKQTVELNDGDEQRLTVLLRPKSRFTAGLFSLFIPGTGQMYSRRPGMGFLMLCGTAAAAYYTYNHYNDYTTLDAEYVQLQRTYNDASSIDDATYWRTKLLTKHDECDRAYQSLKTSALILGGAWIVNFLDAVVFLPRLRRAGTLTSPPSLYVTTTPNRFSIGLKVVF